MPFPSCSTTRAWVVVSTFPACRATTRRCRRCRCGATSRRNATYWRSAPEDLAEFEAYCARERCPYAVVGDATAERRLVLHDPRTDTLVIDLPMDVLFGKPPRMHRDATRLKPRVDLVPDLTGIGMDEALLRVLRLPTVGSKSFLITIGDRTVGGLNHRDPMVGPVASTGRRCRGDHHRFRRLYRRSDGDGRACAGGLAQQCRCCPPRGRRSHHQPGCGTHRRAQRSALVGKLDGGGELSGRRRGACSTR